jgi:threonylcarbamoyladenosine tRNA methylthiotransferase CDKAL1
MTNFYIKSFGCSANTSDGEIMGGLLSKSFFKESSEEESADIIILNICTVKGEFSALREIRKIIEKFPYKKIIISGCITNKIIEETRKLSEEVSFVSTHNILEIAEAAEETLNDNPITIIAKKNCKKTLFPRIRKNKIIGIVQIASGCINKCSYCSTKLIKGTLKSNTPDELIQDIKNLVSEGCKEIWLTSQDCSCYGFDINTNITELLKKVCSIDGDFLVRLGMGNPKHLIKYLSEIIESFKNPKMFKFLHIPVQSGNNEILKEMKRGYTTEDFENIVKKFKEEIPEITISTDIIVGFPGEEKKEFEDSIKLIEKIKPSVLNISRFIPREKTPAFEMKNIIKDDEKKERSRKLTSLHEWISFEDNRKWKNWEGEILIDEKGKEGTSIGRNHAYKPVVVKKEISLGEKVKVKITGISQHYLVGEIKNQ